MFGLNKRINVIQTSRPISSAGDVAEEVETVLFENIPAAIQSHVLNNLPPPSDRQLPAGNFNRREFRCWITTASIADTTPRTTWIIEDVATGEKFRVRQVVDDAGRSHHWLLRLESYNG